MEKLGKMGERENKENIRLKLKYYTANVLSVKIADVRLRSKSKDNF